MINKLFKLIRHPKSNYNKVIPYLKYIVTLYKRKIFEQFGSDEFSKPYAGHDKLLEIINFKNGFCIEVGGNDGYFHSPTYYLERFKGWRGVLVEPLNYI
jgi:hypothetical protein